MKLKSTYQLFGCILFILVVLFFSLVKQAKQDIKQQEFNTIWNDMVDSTTHFSAAGVSIQDSIQFELDASLASFIDLPEETPITGDHMCAFVKNDTVFIEHYHGQPYFQFLYNY